MITHAPTPISKRAASDAPNAAESPVRTAGAVSFVPEHVAYALLERAGLQPPRHALLRPQEAPAELPFVPGEPIVLKGLGDNVWHKSELGCVRFLPFDPPRLAAEADAMRARVEADGHRWLEALVAERIAIQRQRDLPSEAFISLSRTAAGWVLLCGFGGLQANALAELAPPCRWPLDVVTPTDALAEFSTHLLGRTWLGTLRDTPALTTTEDLGAFFAGLWRLAARADAEGITLLELNPVALDPTGRPRPLDAVGQRALAAAPHRFPPPPFLDVLRAPQRVALAGVSSTPGGVGRTILENLQRANIEPGNLLLIKPPASGATSEPSGHFLGLPCVADVAALRASPVDLLILALPAPAACDTVHALLAQGGGARVVALVAGGLGDGADTQGLGTKLTAALQTARTAGRWTPALLGPNFLGHWAPASGLDTSFIPVDKLAAPAPTGGALTLLSQSGAFLLCRRSRQPQLPFGLGVALGNQLDVSVSDVLTALAAEPSPGPVACYVEGFGAGQLSAFAHAARTLTAKGGRVLLHRAGRTAAGQAAAASHTGAMAGDIALERALLERSGVNLSTSIAEFDAALAWLAAYPQLTRGPVALLTNAGFESVNGSDLFGPALPSATLDRTAVATLRDALGRHRLERLVNPQLPLDLTPMADEAAFLATADILLDHSAVLVVGLVPFTRTLGTAGEAARNFADRLAGLARSRRKPLGVAVDAGVDYAGYRAAFVAAGVPTFERVEDALQALKLF
jgi:acyl-CoA synthetase (NDP forming)